MRCGSATLQRLFVSDLLPRKPLALQSAKGFHFWNMIPHRFSESSMKEGLELAQLSDTTGLCCTDQLVDVLSPPQAFA
jgi:hypothetical protein